MTMPATFWILFACTCLLFGVVMFGMFTGDKRMAQGADLMLVASICLAVAVKRMWDFG